MKPCCRAMEKTIPLSQIDLSHFDLRYYRSKEFTVALSHDISKHGLLIPIVVTPTGKRYLVVDGVNRLSAIRLLKWKEVKCDVWENKTEAQRLMLALKVNYFRQSHDIMGVARIFKSLTEKYKVKQRDIAKEFNMSKSYVSKLISFNRLPEDKKLALSRGELDMRTAYDLVRKKRSPELMEKLNIKYPCDGCHGKFDLSQIVQGNLCLDCQKLLADFIKKQKEKLKRERSQTGL